MKAALSSWRAPALAGLLLALGLASACEGRLSPNLEGKACSAQGECLPGYTCDASVNVCVRNGTLTDGGAGEGPGPAPTCMEGETVCGTPRM